MKIPKSKTGLLFVAPYLLLTVTAFSFAFFMIAFYPTNSELVGVYPVIMTLPWSVIGLSLMGDSDSTVLGVVILITGACLNSWILYRIGRLAEK